MPEVDTELTRASWFLFDVARLRPASLRNMLLSAILSLPPWAGTMALTTLAAHLARRFCASLLTPRMFMRPPGLLQLIVHPVEHQRCGLSLSVQPSRSKGEAMLYEDVEAMTQRRRWIESNILEDRSDGGRDVSAHYGVRGIIAPSDLSLFAERLAYSTCKRLSYI